MEVDPQAVASAGPGCRSRRRRAERKCVRELPTRSVHSKVEAFTGTAVRVAFYLRAPGRPAGEVV